MAALGPEETLSLGQDIDPNASPVGSIDTNTTPDTEFSPPDSPVQLSGPPKDKRALARQKLATLTLEEKVRRPVVTRPCRGHRELTCSRCPF
jgi:beta-glucosidase